MLRKLGSYPRQNGLASALRELGRIERTLFMLDWLQNLDLRRRVNAGLNKGEARNALARAVFFASPHCTAQAALRSWFISGNVRIRLPVAAKIALSTAGAATAIVGSPTPPQKSPVGTTTTSTFGISSMRITL